MSELLTNLSPEISRDLCEQTGQVNGRQSEGLWPEVDRGKLAGKLGKHVSSVSHYFSGARKPPLAQAVRIAELIGVTVQELEIALARQQKEYRARVRGGLGRPRNVLKRSGRK